jgi:hypothetical protein
VKVLDRQQFGLPSRQPFCALAVLAFGTMAIAAGVITDAGMTALAAFFDMTAEHGGAAHFDGAHDPQLL